MARHGSQVREILDRLRMQNPKVFGSVARGDDVDGSDLDTWSKRLRERRSMILLVPNSNSKRFWVVGLRC
jgi:predicted nucleotidyltransferase